MKSYPPDWRILRLVDIGEVITGTTPSTKKKEYYGGDYKLISPANLDNGKYVTTWHKSLSKAGFEKCRALPRNTILVGCIGNVGKIGMTADDMSATNQQINSLICKSRYDPHYIYYSLVYNRPLLESAAVKTTVSILNKSNFEEFKIVVPPLPEQRKIAAVLSLVQRAIKQHERLIQLTTELKKALLRKLFTEGTRGEPQKMTEIGPVPESWEVLKFSRGVEIKKGQVDPKQAPYNRMLHVGPENIERDTGRLISLKTNEELGIKSGNYYFTKKEVLYSKIRPYLNKVAIPDFEGTCSADMYPLKPKENLFIREFLAQFLLSEIFRQQAISHQDRTGIPKINRNQLGSTLIPKPSIREQKEIADLLGLLDEKLKVIEKKRQLLQSLFRTLLHQLMTTQIRVADLDTEELGIGLPDNLIAKMPSQE